MKKRNLIQKMMAVLLAVLLVMGMAQSAVVSVLARDADSNDIGTTEEGTENKLEADDGTEEESVIAMAAGGSITQDGYTWKIPDTMNITVGEEESGGIYGGGGSLYSA